MDEGENEQCGDEDAGGYGDDDVRGEPAADVREAGGADDGAEAHAAVEDAVTERALMEVLGGDDGEQGPDGADEAGEDESTGEGSLQQRRVLDVAQAGAHGPIDPFGGQRALEDRVALPLVEDVNHADEGERVEQEGPAGAGIGVNEGRDGQAAESRAESAGEVESGAVERYGLGKLLARDELGNDGLPCGAVHGRADAEQEGEAEQHPGRDDVEEGEHAEQSDRGEHPGLPEEQQAAAVEDVGGGSGEEAEHHHGQAGRGLHQRDQQRRRREHRHQPGAGGVLHPAAEVGDGGGDPEIPKEGSFQRRKP